MSAPMGVADYAGRPARPLLGRLRLRLSLRLQLALAYVAAVVPALAVGMMQPVWQLTDEAQHFDVVAQYAARVYPVEGVTTLRPETAAIMQETGNYRWSPPASVPRPAVTDPSAFGPAPAFLDGYQYRLWVRRHIWWFSYEAMQPPLFYAAALPVWLAADHAGGPWAAVYALRVLNALALGLLAPLALLAARALMPRRRTFAAAAVAVTVATPGLLLNGSQVTNDTFGAVLGSATILLAAGMARRGWTWRTAALLGALAGLTLLAKLTAAGIVFGLLVAWVWPAWRAGAPRGRQLRLGLLAAGVTAVVLTPWLALTTWVYGHPVPSAEAAHLVGAGTSGSTYSLAQSLDYCFETFWTGEHRNTLPLTGVFVVAMLVAGLASVVGLERLVRRRGAPTVTGAPAAGRAEPALLAVFGAAVAGQAAWALSIPMTSGLGGMTPGRYLYPVAVPALVLFTAGLFVSVRRRRLLAGAIALFVGLSAVNFGAYAAGYTAIRYLEPSGPPSGVAVQSVDAEGTYRMVTVDVDRIVTDRRAGSVWAHIHVRNDSPLAADWWPAPAVRVSNGVRARSDYGSSTPFPETLPGGSDYWGWLRLGVPPRKVPSGATLTLSFEDVAANHYRDVGVLVVKVELPRPPVAPAVPPAPRAE